MSLLDTLGARCRIADPQHLAIFRGLLTVALFTLLGKLMSAAKEMSVAYRYGLAAEVDAYQFVYNLVSWPLGIWASVLAAVLVPLVARMRVSSPQAIPRFRAELAGFTLVLGMVLALLGWLVIGALLRFDRSGLPAHSAQLAAMALPGLILMLPLGLLVALLSTWLLAAQRHVNTLLECVPTLCITAAVLLFAGGGISPLVWGTIAGCACHLLTLLAPLSTRRELETPVFTRDSAQWQWFWQGFGIMLAGQALMSFTVIIDQFYAVGLGTGALAMLGYANRVLSLILGLAAIAVSRATLPVFSQVSADAAGQVYRVAVSWARLMFAGGVAVMLLSYLAAPWVIRLLFERGQFDATDTAQVAEVLRYGLPQLPFYFASMVLVSYALSQRRYGLIAWSGVIGCGGKVLGNLVLVPHLGVNGIALATMAVYGLNALFFWLALRHRSPPRRTASCL
jgi:putative peptidoglycan lipid II flippase